ncbi:U3 snoRNP protein, partial [Perkinsus olseni]
AATAGSIECSSGVLEALHYRGWTPDSDEAIANLIHACADTRGPVREAALSLLLAKWPQSTPISSALSMEATGPLGIDTERERMIRIGRLAESITTNTQATKVEISIAAKILVAEYSVPLSTLWPSTTTALSKLVSDDPNGPTAKTRRSEVWQALKESIQSVWPLMARLPVHDDGDEQMASEESMADRALVVAKAAEEETQVAGPSTRHQQLCRAIAAVIGASPQMRKEKSEENEWLVTSCLDVLKGRYEYDTTVGGPTASVA